MAENQQSAVAVAPVVPLIPNPTPVRDPGPALLPDGIDETDNLATLLLHKVASGAPGGGSPGREAIDVRAAYLRYRFAGRLRALQRGNRTYSRLDTALNLASIAAGIGASLIAASESAPLWTISLGVAIAACQTLSQWLKPSQRAAQRGRAALELRNEAWNILQGRDHYRGKNVDRAWDIFCRQVDRIDGRALSQDEAASGPVSTTALKGGGRAAPPRSNP